MRRRLTRAPNEFLRRLGHGVNELAMRRPRSGFVADLRFFRLLARPRFAMTSRAVCHVTILAVDIVWTVRTTELYLSGSCLQAVIPDRFVTALIIALALPS